MDSSCWSVKLRSCFCRSIRAICSLSSLSLASSSSFLLLAIISTVMEKESKTLNVDYKTEKSTDARTILSPKVGSTFKRFIIICDTLYCFKYSTHLIIRLTISKMCWQEKPVGKQKTRCNVIVYSSHSRRCLNEAQHYDAIDSEIMYYKSPIYI